MQEDDDVTTLQEDDDVTPDLNLTLTTQSQSFYIPIFWEYRNSVTSPQIFKTGKETETTNMKNHTHLTLGLSLLMPLATPK